MQVAKSLDLWQEGELDPESGLPYRRSTLIPEGYTAFPSQKEHPMRRLKTFFRRLKSKYCSRRRQNDNTSSQQTSQQHSSFRNSMIASARVEKEHTGFKATNKLENVPYGSTAANQVVWRNEPCPLTEEHPILRAHPDLHIPSEHDTAIYWALDRMFGNDESQA